MLWIRFAILLCILFPFSISGQVEVCDNGIDDDNNNLIDLNDDQCDCQIATSNSIIPNPSFEELDCCPDDRSQLYCATDWTQASAPTTDFIHECGWLGLMDYPPPRPFPDGEGILGFRDGRNLSNDSLDAFWKEYAGACLINPIQKDSSYRFQFDIGFVDPERSPPINVSLFGTASCDFLPFGIGDVGFGCPQNSPNWIRLGDVFVSGGSGNTWVREHIDFVPEVDIRAFAIGPDCNPIESEEAIYYFLDDLRLTDLEAFDLQITEIMHPCNQTFRLEIPENSDFEYQWYLSGVALEGEVFNALTQNYGEGTYQVRILSGTSCRLSIPYDYIIPSYNISDTIILCKGDSYTFGASEISDSGFYVETFQSQNNCDSTVAILLEVLGEDFDTIDVRIAPGGIFELGDFSFEDEGAYELSLNSAMGCDSLILLNLSYFNVFIPNTFSPNDDGVNDLFQPFSASGEVISYHMEIYDRWGNLIYQGDVWDGSDFSTGPFVYKILVNFIDGASNVYYGSVTLSR